MINKVNMRKWVDALRSGKYVQGRSRLRCNNRFCCLGVACDIYRQETGNGEWMIESKFGDGFRHESDSIMITERALLPNIVADWLGVNDERTVVTNYLNGRYTAMELNDSIGLYFNEIADILEETYLK